MSTRLMLIVLALWGAFTWYMVETLGNTKADLKEATRELQETRDAYNNFETERQTLQQELQVTAQRYLKELKANEDTAANIVAQFTADNKRLRFRLANSSSECSGTSGGGSSTDGRAELHRETSEALIRITTDADSQVKALQGTIRVLQKQPKE